MSGFSREQIEQADSLDLARYSFIFCKAYSIVTSFYWVWIPITALVMRSKVKISENLLLSCAHYLLVFAPNVFDPELKIHIQVLKQVEPFVGVIISIYRKPIVDGLTYLVGARATTPDWLPPTIQTTVLS